ncbi:MAG: hypothetical protein AAF602_14615 [Myxococcota bacterium]
MRAYVLAAIMACGNPPLAETEPTTPPPVPVPEAPASRTVWVLASERPAEGVVVAFHDAVDGTLLGLARTNDDGLAAGPAAPEAVVTVVTNGIATSFFDLPDGEVVELGYPGTGAGVRAVDIQLDDLFDGASRHRASAGCSTNGAALELGVPVSVFALEPCWADRGSVDVLAVALDVAGRVLAASAIADLGIPEAGNGAILPRWSTELDAVDVLWTAGPPPRELVTSVTVGRRGRFFPLTQQFGPGVDDAWTFALAPVGFADAVELDHTWSTPDTAVRRTERIPDVPREVIVVGRDFAPDLVATWDPTTATVTVEAGDGPEDPVLAKLAQLRLTDGEGVLRLWNVIGPPDVDRFLLPELPTDLRGLEARGLTAQLVAADPDAIDRVGRHWAVRPANSGPPPEVLDSEAFRWLVWSEIQTFN